MEIIVSLYPSVFSFRTPKNKCPYYILQMKRMHMILLCVVLILHGQLHAQEPLTAITEKKQAKPPLFASLPEQFEISSIELQKLLSTELNGQIFVQLSSQFIIEGKVVDKNQHTPGTFTVNIRLQNYQNALFNATIRLLADNSTTIQGRILHPKYNDVLILYKDKEKYYFKKSMQRLYMPD